ncbi:MAG: YbbR-like domain-containing protein, partial [Deltaproteobacteria bacterium]|nr:YbbR-like domain-containing protein [Deltaproteobacteria bacterium]
MGEKKAEFSFSDVPLVLLNKPSDLIITGQTADRINLRVSGSRTVLSTLSSSNIKATIDLEEVKLGTTVFRDLIERVKLPNGTKITSISPAEFSLVLDSVVVKKVPVHLDMKGSPQEGYEISHISIKPEFVEVSLAKSEAKELKNVMTAPLDISEVKENVEEEIALVLTGLDPPRSISERKVEISILISEKIIEKTMTNVAVELINSQYKTKVNP